MTFTQKIKQLRTDAGLSQQDIADAIGIARATYASLEADRRPANLNEINSLAEYYQLSPGELISSEAAPSSETVQPYQFDESQPEDITPP